MTIDTNMSDLSFIALYNSHGNAACQAEFGISRMTVCRWLKRLRASGHDIPPAKYGRPFTTDYNAAELWEMAATMTMVEISRVTGLRYEQVRHSLRPKRTRKAAQRTGVSE